MEGRGGGDEHPHKRQQSLRGPRGGEAGQTSPPGASDLQSPCQGQRMDSGDGVARTAPSCSSGPPGLAGGTGSSPGLSVLWAQTWLAPAGRDSKHSRSFPPAVLEGRWNWSGLWLSWEHQATPTLLGGNPAHWSAAVGRAAGLVGLSPGNRGCHQWPPEAKGRVAPVNVGGASLLVPMRHQGPCRGDFL